MKLKVLKSGVVEDARKVVYKIENGETTNTIVSFASKYFLGDKRGNIISKGYIQILDSRYGITIAMLNNKIYILNSKGDEIKKDLDGARIEKDIIVFCENGLWGVMDFKCNIIIQPICSFISRFKNDIAVFSLPATEKHYKDSWGIINKKGEIIVEATYKFILVREDKVIALNMNELYGCINFDKSIIAPFIYTKMKLTDKLVRLYTESNSIEEFLINI